MKPIFLSISNLNETVKNQILKEEFSYNAFIAWAARKIKGYSVKEIDVLARGVINIKTHEEKTDIVKKIREAQNLAQAKLEKEKAKLTKDSSEEEKNDVKYLEEHNEILNVLMTKAQAFNIVDHLEKNKGNEEKGKSTYKLGDD